MEIVELGVQAYVLAMIFFALVVLRIGIVRVRNNRKNSLSSFPSCERKQTGPIISTEDL